jgi:hypothetical protein
VRSCELGYDFDWRAGDVRFGVIHIVWQTSPLSPVHPHLPGSATIGWEQSQQNSIFYSITSSASASNVGGTSRPKRPCGLEVDHELELGRLLDCELGDDLRAVTF